MRIDIDTTQLTRNLRVDLAICSDASLAFQAINLGLGDRQVAPGLLIGNYI